MSRAATDDLEFPRPLTHGGQPDPLLLKLARANPVLRVIGPSGQPAWLVAGDHEVREVLSSPSRFSSNQVGNQDERARSAAPMVGMDPPEHTRLRRLAAKAFSGPRIREMAPGIERAVGDLLGDLEAAGPPADLVAGLATPLPMAVICQVLDIPRAEHADLHTWSRTFTSLDDRTAEEIGQAVQEFNACIGRLVTTRRARLGPDLLSDLIRARDGRDALTEQELISTVEVLIMAGHETTAKAITRGTAVLTTSGGWPRLARGEIPVHQVVEEVLRHQSPIDTAIWRTARVDTRLAGAAIKAGDPVYVSLHLANFDAASRRYPEGFDPDRTDTGHVSFGHGAHFCLGAVLARTELAIVFSALAERFPALRLAVPLDELEWTVGSMLNAPTSLPVSW